MDCIESVVFVGQYSHFDNVDYSNDHGVSFLLFISFFLFPSSASYSFLGTDILWPSVQFSSVQSLSHV